MRSANSFSPCENRLGHAGQVNCSTMLSFQNTSEFKNISAY